MKQLFLLLSILLCIQSFSQSNLQIGAKWTYSQYTSAGEIGPSYVTIISDSIINGYTWYKLKGDVSCSYAADKLPFIREEDSKWLIYDADEQREALLYDFSLGIGETYIVTSYGPNYPIDVRIDSVVVKSINGVDYRVQYGSNPTASQKGLYFALEVIEGIGSTGYLFPQGNICDPQAGPFRCFENADVFLDFDLSKECDVRYWPSSTEEKVPKEIEVAVYPNPASMSQGVNFRSDSKLTRVEIFTKTGQLIHSQFVTDDSSVLMFPRLGVYFVRFIKENHIIVRKVIITD